MRTVFLDSATLHLSDLDTRRLDAELDDAVYWPDTSPEDVAARIQDAEVIVSNKVAIRREHIEKAGQLQLISLAATGSDNIDLAAAQENGVAVSNIRDYCTASVVQHVFALVLTLNQNLDSYRRQVQDGSWARSREFSLLQPTVTELQGKTLGVVGYGTLGKGVADVARAFGMRVVTAHTSQADSGLDRLLQEADIVSLHCPLTGATHHLIDAAALAQMQSHALLINTARGGLVDSAALVAALKAKQIGGAGIDVLTREPPVSGDPLLDYESDRLIVTPHMAWNSRESRQRAVDQLLAGIQAFAAGEEYNRLV